MAVRSLRQAWMSRRRLRWLLFGLWLLLVLPSLLLIWQTERQIKWEAFHQYRALAEELAQRIDGQLQADVRIEDARSASDYQFLTVGGDPNVSRLLQRSPLAAFPPDSGDAGVLGYFQVDANGVFSTPFLPPLGQPAESYGLNDSELRARGERSRELLQVLESNELVAKRPLQSPPVNSRENRTDGEALSGFGSRAASVSDASRSAPAVAETDQVEQEVAGPASESRADVANEAAAPMAQQLAPPAAAAPERKQAERQLAAAEPEPQSKDDSNAYLANQRGFDELQSTGAGASRKQRSDYGRLDDLKLQQNFAKEGSDADALVEQRAKKVADALEKAKSERAPRKEQVAEVSPGQALDQSLADLADGRVRMFEGELDPLEFGLLGSTHGVLYRKVWRDGQRWIQGLVLDQSQWLKLRVEQPFKASPLAGMSDLLLVYRGDVLQALRGGRGRDYLSASELKGEVLLQSRLSAPFADLQLVWTINELPAGPGARAVRWSGAVLLVAMTLVFLLLNRLGGRQIDLARQQQDFVSAVSHELKTPLTSIRMYGELLLQGWASEEKKREYYGFIHEESERLSRLIGNVLQLARMERNELSLNLEPRSVDTLADLARSKLAAQVERAGFVLNIEVDQALTGRSVQVDTDAWLQIVINLVDNALKFSQHAAQKQIDLQLLKQAGQVCVRVRDYGPGIPNDQLQKIFRLFYRVGSELTRETVGTGIGLALARQLARAMQGELDVRNREPGAEFELRLPLV